MRAVLLQVEPSRSTHDDKHLDRTQSDQEDEQLLKDVSKDHAGHPNPYVDLDPDKLLDAYGFGRYQFFGYFLSECLNFFYSAAMYVMPYVEPNPILGCVYKNKSLPVDESCQITADSEGSPSGVCGVAPGTSLTIKDPEYSTSLITEFDISCSSFVWKEAGLTAFTVGMFSSISLKVESSSLTCFEIMKRRYGLV
ncbi:hypothetical protein COOONC_13067 [Cooperia oncophora]